MHIANGSVCPTLQWECGQENGTEAIPAPDSLLALCLVLGTAPAAWPGAGMVAMPQLSIQARCPITSHNLQVTLARGIICRDFLHLQCPGVCVSAVWEQLSSE